MRPRCLASLLLLVAATLAQDGPESNPDTPEQAADRVLAALQANDEKALKALAEKNKPDPWAVADELCFRGEHDAAESFAKAAPRADTEKLPAYVASRRGKPPNAAGRKALATLRNAIRAKDAKAALAAAEAVDVEAADVTSLNLRADRGYVLRVLKRGEESAKAYVEAASAAERVGWLRFAAWALREGGLSAYYRSDWPATLTAWERGLVVNESRGDRAGVARSLVDIGRVHQSLGNFEKALEFQERALHIHQELGHQAGVVHALGNTGIVHWRIGNYAEALDYLERARRLAEDIGDDWSATSCLTNIGLVHGSRGEFREALEYAKEALEAARRLEDRRRLANALTNLGNAHQKLGEYAPALEHHERALEIMREVGDRAGAAAVLGSIGGIHQNLGAQREALRYLEESLAIRQRLNDRVGMSSVYAAIGTCHARLGEHAKALALFERSLSIEKKLGSRSGEAAMLGAIGAAHEGLGNEAKALDYYKRALELEEELGDLTGVAGALGNIGNLHRMREDFRAALPYFEREHELAVESGDPHTEIHSLLQLSITYRELGRYAEALDAARDGVKRLSLLVRGLGERQGATARDEAMGLFEAGIRAGVKLRDAAAISFFMESGRAAELLGALGGREALRDAAIPAELRALEADAWAAVRAATARLRSRNRKEVRAARAALAAAHDQVLDAVARIQRAAKASADVVYPHATELADIQANLAPDEAFVSYAVVTGEVVALVVERGSARFVREVGTAEDLTRLVRALRLADPARAWREQVAELRKALVESLGLGKETRRLLVSPTGPLSYVPFAALAPDREVVYVPSGTTYGVLLADRDKRGKAVLALGDPDYRAKRDAASTHSRELTPLPGSRKEANAVGEVVLVGDRATETTFTNVVGERERWRAIHLACHGLVNPERPTLSSLALTPDDESDGFLTVLEVFRTKMPADLVVLSACETAKGKIYRAEGVVGFTRAFMFAGAPRVIVSLWKVDDEATRALMVEFYKLWKSASAKATADKPGMATATALKKAQEHVKSQEKWKHPYYWAAWQLWGLPD